MRIVPALLATVALPLITPVVHAADENRTEYTFRNPTPKEQMREMTTDRPAMTQSPFTVDAGHYQAEIEAFSLGQNTSGGTKTKMLTTEINFKIGVCDKSDLQVVLEPYRSVKVSGNSTNSDKDGLGDLDVRYKCNLWGNNGGETAAAVMPFVTLPTHSDELDSNRDVTGGIIFPFSAKIEKDWRVGVMLEIDLVRNVVDDGYVGQFIQSLSVGRNIAGDLDGFVEILNLASADDRAAGQAYFNAGATYDFSPDIIFDAGINIGLTEASEEVRFLVGISVRR